MIVYNPNDTATYSPKYIEERNKVLMKHIQKMHIQKLHLKKWEHGKPIELVADDFSYFIKYEDGTGYQYYDYDYGIEKMELYQVFENDFNRGKEKYNYED